MTDHRLCVLNAGSSSLKFAVYEAAAGGLRRTMSGEVERIGGTGRLLVLGVDGKPLHDAPLAAADHSAALSALAEMPDGPLSAVGLVGFGHRVVHGGPDLAVPTIVN